MRGLRIVATSDTHGYTLADIPHGDIFIHAGDFTRQDSLRDLYKITYTLGKLPFKHKILIPGNHDRICQSHPTLAQQAAHDNGVIYLADEKATIEGVRFYGFPWTVEFNNWAFMYIDDDWRMKEMCNQIPDDTEVLISHGPPHGILDTIFNGEKAGGSTLLKRIRQLKDLKVHIFGHIHEGAGHEKHDNVDFYNVSLVDLMYKPVNGFRVIDI